MTKEKKRKRQHRGTRNKLNVEGCEENKRRRKQNKKKKFEEEGLTNRPEGGTKQYVYCLGADDQRIQLDFVQNKIFKRKAELVGGKRREMRDSTIKGTEKSAALALERLIPHLRGAGGNRAYMLQGHVIHVMIWSFRQKYGASPRKKKVKREEILSPSNCPFQLPPEFAEEDFNYFKVAQAHLIKFCFPEKQARDLADFLKENDDLIFEVAKKTDNTRDRSLGGGLLKYFECGDRMAQCHRDPKHPWHRIHSQKQFEAKHPRKYLQLIELLLPIVVRANEAVREYRPELYHLMERIERGEGTKEKEEEWEKKGIKGFKCYRCPTLFELGAERKGKVCDCDCVGLGVGRGLFGIFHEFKVVQGPTLFHFDVMNAFVFLFPIDQIGYDWDWEINGRKRGAGVLGGGLQMSLGWKSVGFSYLPGDGVLFDPKQIPHGSRMSFVNEEGERVWLDDISFRDGQMELFKKRLVGLLIVSIDWLGKHGILNDWKEAKIKKKEELNGQWVNENRIKNGGPRIDNKK